MRGVAHDVLSKGANVSLLHRSAVHEGRLHAVVRWSDRSGAAADVDVAALLLGQDGRVRSDEDFVFYNAPTGGDGAVRLIGKRSQDEVSEDRVSVDLEALPPEIRTVVIVASLDATDGVGFGDIPDLALDLLDGAGEPRVRFDVAAAGPETAMVLGELYLRGDEWKFRAVGQGWKSGLAGLAGDYGIDVADPADESTDVGPAPVVNGGVAPTEFGNAAVVGIGILSESQSGADLVELPPSVDADEVSAATAVDQALPLDGGPSTPARAARSRAGVRTRKKRATAATLPPLTLAVDPSWQPARLFSVTGVGNADERSAPSATPSTSTWRDGCWRSTSGSSFSASASTCADGPILTRMPQTSSTPTGLKWAVRTDETESHRQPRRFSSVATDS